MKWLDSTGISVDTRPTSSVLDQLKEHHVIGIIGSDILLNGKPPKWRPDQWIIFERLEFIPTEFPQTFYDVPYQYIPLSQTRYQHISSTLIRTTKDRSLLLRSLRNETVCSYIFDKYNNFDSAIKTLNRNVSGHQIISDDSGGRCFESFTKTFSDQELLDSYCRNSAMWNEISDNPFLSSKIIKVESTTVYETLIPPHSTLFDILIQSEKADRIMATFFDRLNQLHSSMYDRGVFINHGDLSVTNVLCLKEDENRFALIDYDKVKPGSIEEMLREYNQFLSSIEFYMCRYGIALDLDHWRQLGDVHYTVQFKFLPKTREYWITYWDNKRTLHRDNFDAEF
jgi:hypothetical protein